MMRKLKEIFRLPTSSLLNKTMVTQYFKDGGDYKFRFDYHLNEHSIVLDLGGYKGQWASDLFSRYACTIYIFEPVNMFISDLQKRFLYNDRIHVLPFGLGDSNRDQMISVCDDGSSLFHASKATEMIKIVDISTWFEDNNIDRVSVIKINVEGAEYELLNRLIETNLITKIDNIQVQFHNVSRDARSQMVHIQNQLAHTHKLTFQYEFVWENWELIT